MPKSLFFLIKLALIITSLCIFQGCIEETRSPEKSSLRTSPNIEQDILHKPVGRSAKRTRSSANSDFASSTKYSPKELFAIQDAAYKILTDLKMSSADVHALHRRYAKISGRSEPISNSAASNYTAWATVYLDPVPGVGSVAITQEKIETRWEVAWIADPLLIEPGDSLIQTGRRGDVGVHTMLVMTWKMYGGKPCLLSTELLDNSNIPGGPKHVQGTSVYAKKLLKTYSLKLPNLKN